MVGVTGMLPAANNRALNPPEFIIINPPDGATGKTGKIGAVFLDAKVIAIGAGGALAQPIVVAGDALANVALVDLEAVFAGVRSHKVPGIHLHRKKRHIILGIAHVTQVRVADFVQQANFATVTLEPLGVVGNAMGHW